MKTSFEDYWSEEQHKPEFIELAQKAYQAGREAMREAAMARCELVSDDGHAFAEWIRILP